MATITPSSEDTRVYEVAVLYPHPLNQKEESDLQKSIEAIFEDVGATQVMKDVWGRRGLAYKIGGFTEGTFVIYYYDMDPLQVKEADQQLRILKGMLRHMIVKPPKNYQITPYADRYAQWKEQEKAAGERASLEREEKLKKQVVEKAKRQTKKEEKPDVKAAPMTGEAITQELDKLISDKDIDI